MRFLDGVMFAVDCGDVRGSGKVIISKKRITDVKVKDGVSRTILVAEALQDVAAQLRYGRENEYGLVRKKDHWYIGSQSMLHVEGLDMSEGLGAFGVPLNMQTRFNNQNPCAEMWRRSSRAAHGVLACSLKAEFPHLY